MPTNKPSLPANKPRRLDVKLKHPPRKMFPFHAEGVTQAKKNRFHGKPWTCDLIAIPMETVRKTFTFHKSGTPPLKLQIRNLQIWLKHFGPALYNPISWRLKMFYKDRRERSSKYLRKMGVYIRQIDGSHRLRALEALDFNFIYVYLVFGVITMSQAQKAEVKKNMRPAIRYHHKMFNRCQKCRKRVTYTINKNGLNQLYTCPHCGDRGSRVMVYPEPV